jgi:hypothetical protein
LELKWLATANTVRPRQRNSPASGLREYERLARLGVGVGLRVLHEEAVGRDRGDDARHLDALAGQR